MTSLCNLKQEVIQGFLFCVAVILSVSRVSIRLRYWNLLASGLFHIAALSFTPQWHHRSYRNMHFEPADFVSFTITILKIEGFKCYISE
jgi:hypothetical protein